MKNVGKIKIITKFLILPILIGHEWRWLETVTVKYVYTEIFHSDGTGIGYYSYKWKPIEFMGC